MCGIVGIFSHQAVASLLYDSLVHLQHRGQDAAGMLTCDNRFYSKHGFGLVREVFTPKDLIKLKGNMGIAHTRYPTAGGNNEVDIQPLWVGTPRGIALAHNGNLTNYRKLADKIRYEEHCHLNSSLDSEVLLHLLGNDLAKQNASLPNENDFFKQLKKSISNIYQEVHGSYSVVAMIIGKGLVAFRDPHGIRPLVWGRRKEANGRSDYLFASETTPFYALGFEPMGNLEAGEVAYVDLQGQLFREKIIHKTFSPCAFEYVYFARPDATLDQVSVYRARLRMGQNLGKQWKKRFPDLLPDVVIPAPFTANTAALSFAHEIGVRYSEGLYKNPFIGRTFIMPDQEKRSQNVRYKLTPQKTEIENKKVLIVDDSIVRGTTSREIIKMVREFGAKEIYLVSTCPPIKHPCFYGIDIPSRKELIAAHMNEEAIRDYLGVNQLLYQTENDLVEAITRRGDHIINRPCLGCMDGHYVCGNLTEQHLERLEAERNQDRSTIKPDL